MLQLHDSTDIYVQITSISVLENAKKFLCYFRIFLLYTLHYTTLPPPPPPRIYFSLNNWKRYPLLSEVERFKIFSRDKALLRKYNLQTWTKLAPYNSE